MRRLVLPMVILGAACGGASPSAPDMPGGASRAAPRATSCARRARHALPAPVSTEGRGGAVALASSSNGAAGRELVAYVADHDSRAVHTVSLSGQKRLSKTTLDGAPQELLVLHDGRVVATLSDSDRIVVLEPGSSPTDPMAELCERQVAPEPWGVAASPDEREIVVASAYGAALTVFDGDTVAPSRVIALARDPRGVMVDADRRVWISHLVGGGVSVVALDGDDEHPSRVDVGSTKSTARGTPDELRARRVGLQAYALASVVLGQAPSAGGSGAEGERPRALSGEAPPAAPKVAAPALPARIVVPMVSVDAGSPDRPIGTYYGSAPLDGVPKQAPMVSVIDPDARRALTRTVLSGGDELVARECLLPRAVSVRASTASVFVACLGIDAVLELDARAVDPIRSEKRRFGVGPGPTGVAVDDASGTAVVFSQFDGKLTVIDLDAGRETPPAVIALAYAPAPEIARVADGRALFYRTDDLRISNDGIACASCHPDGRDDGLTWITPEGPRQTIMLAGRTKDTAPYGWVGHQGDLPGYIVQTVGRLGGKGLAAEAYAIAEFVEHVPAPPGGSRRDGDVRRGREVFFSAEAGCASCHVGGAGTDSLLHDMGKHSLDAAAKFDTPSLRFVATTAPYFHDGRYDTLEQLLSDPRSRMGHSATLGDADQAALLAYLKSL